MAKIFTKLNLADIVATSGGKSFRKLSTESGGLPIWNGTDLTGTTWYIPAGWTATAGYGIFYVDFTYSNETFSELRIGYYGGTSTDNYITIAEGKANIIYLTPSSELSFTFNEGSDTSLIAWLKANGELTSHQMPTPTIITFTIEGKTYQAEEGMTWADWCSSSYNTDGYIISSTHVLTAVGLNPVRKYEDGVESDVLVSDLIINDGIYTLGSHSGGSN